MIVLLTGGSKCGKSSYAERLALALAEGQYPVNYVATMHVLDAEDRRIVARHQLARAGKGFAVLEREKDLAGLHMPPEAVLLLEDVPNLLANEMFGGQGPGSAFNGVRALSQRCRHAVLVTNEVGCDGADYLPETLHYIDELGQLNQRLAALADCVLEVVSGLPQPLKGALPARC